MKKKSPPKPSAAKAQDVIVQRGEDLQRYRDEAWLLETELEAEILKDAVLCARLALEDLKSDTHGPPHERRRGIRLKDKAMKVERAFNRLRALRKGELLPARVEDDW